MKMWIHNSDHRNSQSRQLKLHTAVPPSRYIIPHQRHNKLLSEFSPLILSSSEVSGSLPSSSRFKMPRTDHYEPSRCVIFVIAYHEPRSPSKTYHARVSLVICARMPCSTVISRGDYMLNSSLILREATKTYLVKSLRQNSDWDTYIGSRKYGLLCGRSLTRTSRTSSC